MIPSAAINDPQKFERSQLNLQPFPTPPCKVFLWDSVEILISFFPLLIREEQMQSLTTGDDKFNSEVLLGVDSS